MIVLFSIVSFIAGYAICYKFDDEIQKILRDL